MKLLSKHLDSIPREELLNQYEDYYSYNILYGFNILQENCQGDDLSNARQTSDDIKKKYHLKDWQVIIATPDNKTEITIVYAGIFHNSKLIKDAMLAHGFHDTESCWTLKGVMLWKATKFSPVV
jgi:hypothetical protein